MRPSGRAPDQMRELTFEPGFTRHAEGSCLVSFGDTRVLCTASVEEKVPPFLRGKGQGWVTAEYGMLPRATHTRGNREAAKGKQSGRTQEIQRLIGRSLRAVVDLPKLGERQVIVDCDVIQADGGTRTASISGGWVALRIAVDKLLASKALAADPIRTQVAAVSCGIHNGTAVLDLDYDEDIHGRQRRQFRADRRRRDRRGAAHRRGRDVRRGRPAAAASPRAHRLLGDFRGPAEGDRPMRPIGDKLVIATHNPGKLREIAALVEPLGIACVGAEELGLPEPDEIGVTFADNADLKAREAADLAGFPRSPTTAACASTRSHGRPGIFSARWAEDEDGNRDWMRAMERVWRETEATEPDAAPAAHFVCALAIAWPNDGQTETFEGRVDGTLVWPPRGERGFGYDPMFVPVGHDQTFGEIEPAARSTRSATAPTRSASSWRR